MPIESPDDLRAHIEQAICIELSTIPPYLYAMYSIGDGGSEAALLIRSIVAEEMLHAALATNLLLAVGGKPDFASGRYMPRYPMDVPHHRPPLRLDLAPCSLELVEDLFMRIEQPEERGAPAQPDEFETLGQFYHALEEGLADLAGRFELFSGPLLGTQMADSRFYSPVAMDADDSGGLMPIHDLTSAIQAIEVIVHQGEGLSDEKWADPEHRELTHYHKLLQIRDGLSPLGEVLPLPTNPKASQYPSEIRLVADLFNALYRAAYLALNRIFSAESDQAPLVGVLYLVMGDLMAQVGRFLVSQPLENDEKAAPTFEVYEFGEDGALQEISRLSQQAAAIFPALAPIHEAVHGLELIL